MRSRGFQWPQEGQMAPGDSEPAQLLLYRTDWCWVGPDMGNSGREGGSGSGCFKELPRGVGRVLFPSALVCVKGEDGGLPCAFLPGTQSHTRCHQELFADHDVIGGLRGWDSPTASGKTCGVTRAFYDSLGIRGDIQSPVSLKPVLEKVQPGLP